MREIASKKRYLASLDSEAFGDWSSAGQANLP